MKIIRKLNLIIILIILLIANQKLGTDSKQNEEKASTIDITPTNYVNFISHQENEFVQEITLAYVLWYGEMNAPPNDFFIYNLTRNYLLNATNDYNISRMNIAVSFTSCIKGLSFGSGFLDELEDDHSQIDEKVYVINQNYESLTNEQSTSVSSSYKLFISLYLTFDLTPEIAEADIENLDFLYQFSYQIGGQSLSNPEDLYSSDFDIIRKNMGCEEEDEGFSIPGFGLAVTTLSSFGLVLNNRKNRKKESQ